jgi:hypothetical protein
MNIYHTHAAAMLDPVRADVASPPMRVYDGRADDFTNPPYALVYLAIRTPSGREMPEHVSLENVSDVIVVTGYWHSVGQDADAARSVAGRVRSALLGKTPVIQGRECTPIECIDGQPVMIDETTGVNLADQVDVYTFVSIPA